MQRLKNLILPLLRQGLSEHRAASALALGIAIGVFPIYGMSTLLAGAVGVLFKMNLPILLAGMYAMTWVKPLLILPYLRLGESLFGASRMTISLTELSRRFAEDAWSTLHEFGWSFLHAISGWMITLPLILLLGHRLFLMTIRTWQARA